jgi:hypothetical protein
MFRAVFWVVLPCKMIVDRRFRGAYCLPDDGGSTTQKTALNKNRPGKLRETRPERAQQKGSKQAKGGGRRKGKQRNGKENASAQE